MADIRARIKDAAARNRELLAALAASDHASPALEQHARYIEELERELKDADARLKELERTRVAEHKDHAKYRGSVMRRVAYKVARKEERFEQKASKEEREYFEALEAEHRGDVARRSLAASLDEAQSQRRELEATKQQHDDTQRQLDQLYHSIFEGPTPAFPDEDAAEGRVKERRAAFDAAAAQLQVKAEVVQNLSKAMASVATAAASMDKALDASRLDMFGGGAVADMMERSALGEAQTAVQRAQQLVWQAAQLDPGQVRELPDATIASGSLMGDVLFDNIFSDMAFHDKIKQSKAQVQATARDLDQQAHAARLRHRECQTAQTQRGEELKAAREELQRQRQAAFESVG